MRLIWTSREKSQTRQLDKVPAPQVGGLVLAGTSQKDCLSWSRERCRRMEQWGGVSVIAGDPLPLGDSVLGRGEFPSLRVMHRGSP